MSPYLLDDLDRLEELQRQQDLDDPSAMPPRPAERDDGGSALPSSPTGSAEYGMELFSALEKNRGSG
jgi:hypothetical protein